MMFSTDLGLQTPPTNFRHPQKAQWKEHPLDERKVVNFRVATFTPKIVDVYSAFIKRRSGKGSSSMSLMRGLSGVETVFPLCLNVIPSTFRSSPSFSKHFARSRLVYSPSPRTITSTQGYFLRIL